MVSDRFVPDHEMDQQSCSRCPSTYLLIVESLTMTCKLVPPVKGFFIPCQSDQRQMALVSPWHRLQVTLPRSAYN